MRKASRQLVALFLACFTQQLVQADTLTNRETPQLYYALSENEFSPSLKQIMTDSKSRRERHNYADEEISPVVGWPRVSAQESLCADFNTDENECRVVERHLRFTHDVFFATNSSLVLDASKVKCLTTSYTACSIVIHLTGGYETYIELRNGATIQGKQVVLDAIESQVRIFDDSSISVSGQSLSVNGTQSSPLGVGASFIAQGGGYQCNKTDHSRGLTYGEFDMVPEMERIVSLGSQMGSCGQQSLVETAGGGRIVLLADSVYFYGAGQKLSANGRPYKDVEKKKYSLAGGSGGYIYIKTTNYLSNNTISADSELSATGGQGFGDYGAGSGGVVVLDQEFALSSTQIHINGGEAQKNETADDICMNGGAGTIYHVSNDTLVARNEGTKTKSRTILSIPSKVDAGDEKLSLAAKLFVVDGAQVQVLNEIAQDLTFDELYVYEFSWLQLSQSRKRCHVHITNTTYISVSSHLDFSHTEFASIYPGENATDTTFGNVRYREFFGIEGANVNIIGNIDLADGLKDSYKPHSKVIIGAANITLFGTAKIKAGYTLLHANETLLMLEGSKVKSLRSNTCNVDEKSKDLFVCIKRNSLLDELDSHYLATTFQKQFPRTEKLESFHSVLTGLVHNYTAYMISYGEISMFGAEVSGPRIGICATNFTMQDSLIDSSGAGCASDQGLSRGRQSGHCAGSGGANAGRGGYGGVSFFDGDVANQMTKCQDHYPKRYSHAQASHFEGSGGASGATSQDSGGAGGGIIRLNVLNSTILERSRILANGHSGQLSGMGTASGGGAGGSISIVTKSLKGDSTVEARGGAGSEGGGGGGSGGLLILNYLKGFSIASQPRQSHYWSGSYTLDGGLHGFNLESDDGTFVAGSSGDRGVAIGDKCFGGLSGPFCAPCATGTFKFGYSFAKCQPCENKPDNSFYVGRGAQTSQCPYKCETGLDPAEANPRCENALQLATERSGGLASTLFVAAIILSITLVLWVSLVVHSKGRSRDRKDFNQSVYDGVLFSTRQDVSAESKILKPGELQMRDQEVWCHSHRMYLLGDNSIKFPWYLPKDFPARSLDPADTDTLFELFEDLQPQIEWSSLQKDLYFCSRFLCPPLADLVHRCLRKKHFKLLESKLYEKFPSEFWDQNEHSGKKIRVYASPQDYQLAHIDFLDYGRQRQEYIGPQLPVTLLLSGRGTYNNPYFLNFEEDPLAKSIVYFNAQTLCQHLPLFFENLNTLLARLSFYKSTNQVLEDLGEIIDWIELGNKTLFNPLDTKATLFLIENSYSELSESSSFEQKRRSYPIESVVYESLPQVFKALVDFIQVKTLQGKSEIRLGLVFSSFDLDKKHRLMERVRQIMARNKTDLNDLSSRKSKIKHLVFSDSSSNSAQQRVIEPESITQDQSIFAKSSISSRESFGCIDDSKRAFEISSASVHALEMSILKSRTSCCFKFKRILMGVQALWLQLFRQHGIPLRSKSGHFMFFVFAAAMTADLLLTTLFCIHIFYPVSNLGKVGIPFLFLTPGNTVVAPLIGILGCVSGQPQLLKRQSAFNRSAVLFNYPLTLAYLLWANQDHFYVVSLLLLVAIKIVISFAGSRVKMHLRNPAFSKNFEKIQDRFRSLLQAQSEVKKVMREDQTAEDRASCFIGQGLPQLHQGSHSCRPSGQTQDVESDEDYDDEEDTSFGIIPKSKLSLVTSSRSMSQF